MAVELPAHNAHSVLGQFSDDASILSGSGVGGLQATICLYHRSTGWSKKYFPS